jgi:D-alanyl-D-alanine carboxypeptidase
MPPSRRNLIIICCICLATVYISAIVRIYQTSTAAKGEEASAVDNILLPYAPYTKPVTNFFIRDEKPATSTPQNGPVIAQAKTSPKEAALLVTAKAYLVADLKSDKIYMEKNSKMVLPVASMSKLITAFVATEVLKNDAIIEITEENTKLPSDSSGLTAGEKFPLKVILYPLLLNSSNVAAEALASASDNRIDFLESMSSYAWEVGMPSSFFADASGLSPQNAASARDMLALAKYLHNSRQDILSITRTPMNTVSTTTEYNAHTFTSTHPFVNDPNFLGGKTGRTPEAGETMITLMKINNRPVAFIILGSHYGSREPDTKILIEAAKKLVK